jgi:DNA-binding response OmpR family regulator
MSIIFQRIPLMEPLAKTPRPGILVVDAEELILTFLTYALTDQEFQVWTCRTAEQAAAVLHEHEANIDAALLDVGDGLHNLRTIRELAPRLPCCVMSAVLSGADEAELRDLGAVAILPKPFRLDHCLHILRSMTAVKSSK